MVEIIPKYSARSFTCRCGRQVKKEAYATVDKVKCCRTCAMKAIDKARARLHEIEVKIFGENAA